MKITDSAIVEAKLLNVLIQLLTKVDDRILERTIAAWGVAVSSSEVVFGSLGVADSVIPHVFASTLGANFKVSVSMKLRHHLRGNSTLAMKAINILTDDVLEVLSLHEFNKRHVGL